MEAAIGVSIAVGKWRLRTIAHLCGPGRTYRDMEAYPSPSRGKGRGRGRVGSRRGGGTGGGVRGCGASGRGRGRNGRHVLVDSQDTNHDRYEMPGEDEASSDDGVDFDVAANSAGIQTNTEDADKIALDDDLMRELAADFSCLGQVLASVPLWVRLSSDPSVLDALCHQDGWSKPPEFKNATACGVSVASDELLDAFSALDVGSELHAVASELQRSADVPIEDDFDAWLDDA
jgi:hypothetical protein